MALKSLTLPKLYDFIVSLKFTTIREAATSVKRGTEITQSRQRLSWMIHSFPVILSAASLIDADILYVMHRHPQPVTR